MSSLLPPGSTASERNIEAAIDLSDRVQIAIADLWSPANCPTDLLPWLAWALAVDEWDSSWTEQQKRDVVAASISVQQRKGTVGAVKRAVAALGYDSTIREGFDTGGDPYTFEIYFEPGASLVDPATVQRVVDASKNIRSHMQAVKQIIVAGPFSHVLATTIVGDIITIYPEAI